MIIEGNHIIADDGMWLTDQVIFTKDVYLGKYDTPEMWEEITDEEKRRREEEEEPEME